MSVAHLPPLWQHLIGRMAALLDRRLAARLLLLLGGILFAHGRRTVTSWLRAAQVGRDFQDYYYFLGVLGRHGVWPAAYLLRHAVERAAPAGPLSFALDDTPTPRY